MTPTSYPGVFQEGPFFYEEREGGFYLLTLAKFERIKESLRAKKSNRRRRPSTRPKRKGATVHVFTEPALVVMEPVGERQPASMAEHAIMDPVLNALQEPTTVPVGQGRAQAEPENEEPPRKAATSSKRTGTRPGKPDDKNKARVLVEHKDVPKKRELRPAVGVPALRSYGPNLDMGWIGDD